MHPEADIRIEEDDEIPSPTLPAKKLKDFIRKAAKSGGNNPTALDAVRALFETEED